MRTLMLALAVAAAGTDRASAHSGPPYPIVSRQAAGMYVVSVWTDPDATDDGTAGGQFWIVIEPGHPHAALPADTRAKVAIRPVDRNAPETAPALATPVNGDRSRQFVAVRMDHEGPYRVHVALDGTWGAAGLDAQVEATYDLRPAPGLLAIYLLPFLAVGFLWTRLLLRRRRSRSSRTM